MLKLYLEKHLALIKGAYITINYEKKQLQMESVQKSDQVSFLHTLLNAHLCGVQSALHFCTTTLPTAFVHDSKNAKIVLCDIYWTAGRINVQMDG